MDKNQIFFLSLKIIECWIEFPSGEERRTEELGFIDVLSTCLDSDGVEQIQDILVDFYYLSLLPP